MDISLKKKIIIIKQSLSLNQSQQFIKMSECFQLGKALLNKSVFTAVLKEWLSEAGGFLWAAYSTVSDHTQKIFDHQSISDKRASLL